MGTNPDVACGGTALADGSSSTWPPDFNSDTHVNLNDIVLFKVRFNTAPPNPDYSPRFDLNASGAINIADVVVLKPFFNYSCTP